MQGDGEDLVWDGGDEQQGEESLKQMKEMKRAKNKLHARESRIRKRIRISVMQEQLKQCWQENDKLKRIIQASIPEKAATIIEACTVPGTKEYTLYDMADSSKVSWENK